MMAAASIAGGGFADELVKEVSWQGNSIRLYAEPLSYEVLKDGVVVVPRTEIDLCVDGAALAKGAKVAGVETRAPLACVESSIRKTPVYKKRGISDARNEALVKFGDFGVRLVARPDGVAYRMELARSGAITHEQADLTVPKTARCWFNRTGRGSLGCEETVPEFADGAALKTDGGKAFYLPFVYSAGGKTVAVTDSGVKDYPVWNFGDVEETEAGMKLKALFAKHPKKTIRAGGSEKDAKLGKGGRWVRVAETEDFLVKADSPRALPWRTFILADSPSGLCGADIVYALAEPADASADFSWVKPGKVAWDWWNAFDNKGDPQGCTTATYRRFIDFAAANGVEYVIFDEGWSARLDIWKYSPAVDVPALIDYAEKKGVGIILWMAWAQVYGDEAHVAAHFAKLGAKGFKVDFMDRADAEVAAFLEKFAAECAKNRMLVDYHGAYRPTGLHRKYPNVVNYEGIHGLEQMKWGSVDKDMPMNDVAAFFLRMTAGPMDYTPGAMDNYPVGRYRGDSTNPGSVGTRAHQMALMALYEAPLQMLCDSPTKYEKNMECFSFMAKTPVVWDATVGLGGCPESYAAVARRAKDGSWYAAAITNRDARDIEIATDFLAESADGGTDGWKAEIFRDADASADEPAKYVHETRFVKAGEKLTFHAAPGGGFIVRFAK